MKKLFKLFNHPSIYVCIILLGLLTKIPGLESKFFWLDEVFTMSHTTGIDWEKHLEQIPEDRLMSLAEYNDYMLNIPDEYSATEQLRNLSRMPQLNPLHYFLLVPWTHLLGGSMLSYRVFSLFFFVLSIMALFLWVKMMTPNNITPWVVAALLSISPILNFYSLEARYYTLWLFLFIVSNAVFWQVFRKRSRKMWMLYVICTVLLLYTSALSLLLLAGHFLFVLLYERKEFKNFALSAVLIVLAYAPWMALVMQHADRVMESTNWQEMRISLWEIGLGNLHGLATGFFAVEGEYGMGPGFSMWEDEHGPLNAILQALVVVVLLIATVMMLRKGNRRTANFVLLPLIVTMAFFILFDFSQERIVSIVYRYHITNIAAAYVILAFMLERLYNRKQALGPLLFTVVFVFGAVNYLEFKSEPCYQNPHMCEQQLLVAEALKEAEKPLLLVATQSQGWPKMFAWELTLPIDRGDAMMVLDPTPEGLVEHLKSRQYSDIFLYSYGTWVEITELKFASIRTYQEQDLGMQATPTMVWAYADALLKDDSAELKDFLVDVNTLIQTDTLSIVFSPVEKIDCDSIFIVGNHRSLGSFDPHAVALHRTGAQQWQGKFPIEHGADILFRFTRGNWSMQLGDDKAEQDNDNYYHTMRGDTTYVISHSEWREY